VAHVRRGRARERARAELAWRGDHVVRASGRAGQWSGELAISLSEHFVHLSSAATEHTRLSGSKSIFSSCEWVCNCHGALITHVIKMK
jgi:hypothetical protein